MCWQGDVARTALPVARWRGRTAAIWQSPSRPRACRQRSPRRGEQKALLIGLILGHAELVAQVSGMTPLLLLDEVAAHLDQARRMALFDRLAELGCQSFLTGADPALFADMPAGTGRYQVSDGKVETVGPT
jgi:recombinational DNA repair ATPase RecF